MNARWTKQAWRLMTERIEMKCGRLPRIAFNVTSRILCEKTASLVLQLYCLDQGEELQAEGIKSH